MAMPPRIEPAPDQESVWDYPRPPRIEDSAHHVQVIFDGVVIADTRHAKRVLETGSPPVYYIPPEDVQTEYLQPTARTTICEWKGQARYYTVRHGHRSSENAVWSYPRPTPSSGSIKDYLAFYPGRVDTCLVDDEVVRPQPGDFYGGWITADIVGPFKGDPGTEGW